MLVHLLAAALVLAALEPLPSASQSPSGGFKIRVLHGVDACVVFARDRSLRRVDLATGETTAIASEHMLGPRKNVRIKVIDEQRLFTWTEKKSATESFQCQAYLRDATTLAPIHVIDVPSEAEIAAVAPDGEHVATRDFAGRRVLLSVAEPGRPVPLPGPAGLNAPRARRGDLVAFSRSGSRFGVVSAGRVYVFDSSSQELLSDLSALGAPNIGMLRFYDEEHVLLGWEVIPSYSGGERAPPDLEHLAVDDGEAVGVDMLRIDDGDRIARMIPRDWPWGGSVCDLRGDPALGTVTYTISNAGAVSSFGGEDWEEQWQVDYGMGNPHGLFLPHVPGSKRTYICGMGYDFARVLDTVTGENLAEDAGELGLQLAGTSGERFIICSHEHELLVRDGQTFELLYSRTEGTDGTAWMLRDGERIDLGAPQPAGDTGELPAGDKPR